MVNIDVPSDKRGDPWFDDGNIILLTDEAGIAFKVHRGILARHSEIFQTMFELPPPTQSDTEMLDNCQVVRMYDLPLELSHLIKALYDGATFQTRNLDDFFYLAAILRLSTKYFIAHLRLQAIRHLAQTWTYTLRDHDRMLERALKSPLIEDRTYPYVHPLHVINLARETHISIVLPCAFYFLSFYPLVDLKRRDHPKLKVDHPSRPSSQLSAEDLEHYTAMYQHRLDVIIDFIRKTCGSRTTFPHCQNGGLQCNKAFSRLTTKLSRSWMIRTGPLHYMVQAMDELSQDHAVCAPCLRAFQRDVTVEREMIWKGLPSVVGLPSWENLQEMDFNSR